MGDHMKSGHEVKLSVKNLIEFIMQGGSIDNRFGGADRALEGARIHRMLQKAGGEGYQSEVYLRHTEEYGGILFTIDGRADGIFTQDGLTAVDEIKTTAAPLALITEDFNRLHWAQAMCYGYFLCERDALLRIVVRLTYYQIETREIKRFSRTCERSELEAFYEGLLESYLKFADWQVKWLHNRDHSIHAMPFPFESYRTGQRELAVAVYRTIEQGSRLYCQAPTGVGKTISTLFPAVKAMGAGEAEKLFYLTAKTITRQAAQDAVSCMQKNGLKLKSIALTAKDKICFLEQRSCNPQSCTYADGHYDRVNEAVFDIIQECDAIGREEISDYAQKHRVCPFEFMLDITLWCDVIICDYNYLFDPTVYLRRFFGGGKGKYVFLVDEAHNLVERSREMFSAQVEKSAFSALRRQVGKRHKPLYDSLQKVNSALLELRQDIHGKGRYQQAEPMESLNKNLLHFCSVCEQWLSENGADPAKESMLEVYFSALHYLKIAELYDERYTTVVEWDKTKVFVRQFCLDPSYLLQQAYARGKAAVLFSATFSPISYFSAVLGADEQSRTYCLPAPFSQRHLGLVIADYIDTRYAVREQSYEKAARLIAALSGGRPGNYMAYFPSYQYMNAVCEIFTREYPDAKIVMQENQMDEAAREAFLEVFTKREGEPVIGFCVLGGIFSEGIDLKGDALLGTVVFGVGLPQLNPDSDLLRTYYDGLDGQGYEYAYLYPGMNKVMQAAGRVIRTENDRGIVILAESRFAHERYTRLFPPHWSECKVVRREEDITRFVADFWTR